MREEFERITPTDNRKLILVRDGTPPGCRVLPSLGWCALDGLERWWQVMFCFAITLAVVAPAGSNFVLAGVCSASFWLLSACGSWERVLADGGAAARGGRRLHSDEHERAQPARRP